MKSSQFEHKISITNPDGLLRPGLKFLKLFGLLAGLVSCAQVESRYFKEPQVTRSAQDSFDQMIEKKISSLSLEEKIGQFLVIGLSGQSLSLRTKSTLQKVKPGGVILFSRNIGPYKAVRSLTDDLQRESQKYSHLPLLVMLDQEGGVVTRVKVGTSLPSALALAQTRHPQFIRGYSKIMGSLLNRLGINMNLAPVLDVSDPKSDSFIGSRSFGQSPTEVAELGVSFALGQWDAGVIPTAKHFPGHGGLKTDSHKETPRKNLSKSELLKTEIVPFHSFAQLQFPRAAMLGHVSFPKIDPTGYPAAFSPLLNQQLLREDLKFDGLAITDDLEMAGAEKVGSIAERTIQAIIAGNDMIMVAWSEKRQRQAYQTLFTAVKSGRISEERLHQSLKRILTAKYRAQQKAEKFKAQEVEGLRTRLVEMSKDVKKLSFQSSLKERMASPIALGDEIFVYSSDKLFFKQFQRTYSRSSKWVALSRSNVKNQIFSLNKVRNPKPFIFYVSGIGTARWLDRLSHEQKKRAIVVNANQPGAIKNQNDFLKVVHLNSSSPESGAWLAEYLNQMNLIRRPTQATESSDQG